MNFCYIKISIVPIQSKQIYSFIHSYNLIAIRVVPANQRIARAIQCIALAQAHHPDQNGNAVSVMGSFR